MSTDIAVTHPYTDADLESVRPSQLREGDLIAHAGPVGAHRYVGDPVTSVAWAGYSATWQDDTYRVEYLDRHGEGLYFVNPDRLRVWRVREDRRLDGGRNAR
jgi:hypothetical protein